MIITHMHYTLPPHKRAEEGRPGEKNQCGSGRVGTHYHSVVHSSTPSHDPMMKGQKEGGLVKKKPVWKWKGLDPFTLHWYTLPTPH